MCSELTRLYRWQLTDVASVLSSQNVFLFDCTCAAHVFRFTPTSEGQSPYDDITETRRRPTVSRADRCYQILSTSTYKCRKYGLVQQHVHGAHFYKIHIPSVKFVGVSFEVVCVVRWEMYRAEATFHCDRSWSCLVLHRFWLESHQLKWTGWRIFCANLHPHRPRNIGSRGRKGMKYGSKYSCDCKRSSGDNEPILTKLRLLDKFCKYILHWIWQ